MKTSPRILTKRVQPISTDTARQMLLSAMNRSKLFLHGQSAQELSEAFKEAEANYPAARQAFVDLCTRARRGDDGAMQELAEIQMWTIDNFVKVTSVWASFMEQMTLGESDFAMFENVDHHEVFISSIVGQDGGQPMWQRIRAHQRQMIPFYGKTSQEFEYTLKDWYSGMVADRAKAGLDIAGDLSLDLDKDFFNLVAAGIGNFTLTGNTLSRVYVPSKRFNTDNLPTTNLLTQTGITTTSLLTIEGLKLVIKYARSWGENAFGDGPLTPTAIFLPSSLFTGFLDQIEVDDPENFVNAQIFDFGTVVNYGGYNWTFISDPTLRPNDGLAYVRFNKPYGRHWSKPSMDDLIIDDSVAKRKNNLESMLMTKVFATFAPAQRRTNIAAIRFRTAS